MTRRTTGANGKPAVPYFDKIHQDLIGHPDIPLAALMLFGVIQRFARLRDGCIAGNDLLAKQLRRSTATVRRYLILLEALGMIRRSLTESSRGRLIRRIEVVSLTPVAATAEAEHPYQIHDYPLANGRSKMSAAALKNERGGALKNERRIRVIVEREETNEMDRCAAGPEPSPLPPPDPTPEGTQDDANDSIFDSCSTTPTTTDAEAKPAIWVIPGSEVAEVEDAIAPSADPPTPTPPAAAPPPAPEPVAEPELELIAEAEPVACCAVDEPAPCTACATVAGLAAESLTEGQIAYVAWLDAPENARLRADFDGRPAAERDQLLKFHELGFFRGFAIDPGEALASASKDRTKPVKAASMHATAPAPQPPPASRPAPTGPGNLGRALDRILAKVAPPSTFEPSDPSELAPPAPPAKPSAIKGADDIQDRTLDALARVVADCETDAIDRALRLLMRQYIATDRQPSQKCYADLLHQVRRGEIPTEELVAAYRESQNKGVRRPGALFVAKLKPKVEDRPWEAKARRRPGP